MIRRCTDKDTSPINAIINDAATAHRGIIPDDCWHEPYMGRSELFAEVAAGIEFWCYEEQNAALVGVMGVQDVGDVTLIRHAYVKRSHQGRGIGSALLKSLIAKAPKPLLIGTWAAAEWAIGFYSRHGFEIVERDDALRLLETY